MTQVMKRLKKKRGLIIGDAHASPLIDNRRFDWLGNAILEEKPDFIVQMGDFEDFASLCSYDRGTKSFEGRRLREDYEVANDAGTRAFKPIDTYNQRRSNLKKKQYRPKLVHLGGNHAEGRIKKMLNANPEYEGIFGVTDGTVHLEYMKLAGGIYVPFLKVVTIEGIQFSHYFYKTLQSYSPPSIAAMLNITRGSAIMGHNHIRGFEEIVQPNGKRTCGAFCGAYLDHEITGGANSPFNYTGPQQKWWRGLLWLDEVAEGEFDPQFMSMSKVKRLYS